VSCDEKFEKAAKFYMRPQCSDASASLTEEIYKNISGVLRQITYENRIVIAHIALACNALREKTDGHTGIYDSFSYCCLCCIYVCCIYTVSTKKRPPP